MFLTILIWYTVVLLFVSLFMVLYDLPLFKKGWKFEVKAPVEVLSKESQGESKENEVDQEVSVKPIDPSIIRIEDLEEGDIIFVETVSGSRYRFSLKNASQKLYHLKGMSSSRRKYFDIDVVVQSAFRPGRGIVFSTPHNEWLGTTSAVVRLLVERSELSVISS